MKNKIRVLAGMLIMILLLTAGCGKKETLSYDQQTITQITEFMIDYSSSVDEETVEQLKTLRESTFEDQLANMGLSITPDNFVSVLEAWKAGEKECGAYVDHGAYTIKATADELHVTTEAKFQNRDAELEFVFDRNLYLESLTVGAHYSMGEILKKAGMNTLLGMGTVFVVLILISVIISLFKYIPAMQERMKNKKAKKKDVADGTAEEVRADVTEAATDTDNVVNDEELVAVIAAAIAAAEGTTTDGFVVRSIRRRPSNKWNR